MFELTPEETRAIEDLTARFWFFVAGLGAGVALTLIVVGMSR